MAEYHIAESELAEPGGEALSGDLGDHLSWCRECQNAKAEFRWIGRELETGMREDAAHLLVPQPDWRSVAIRTGVSRRRVTFLRCGSLVVSMLLMVWSFAVTGSLPDVAMGEVGLRSVPHPVLAETRHLEPVVMATPAPRGSTLEAQDAKTPVLVLLPTPL